MGQIQRIGVDTGGTFTDVVLAEGDELRTGKVPSTPADPSLAVARGVESVEPGPGPDVIHGTTVALNALLTGRTARVALVTGSGFRDLMEIGRQERPDIYSLHPHKAPPLAARELRFEVGQRSFPDGQGGLVEKSRPGPRELEQLAARIGRSGAESIAVCLLHSYEDPTIERQVADALESLGLPISCSAELLPTYREVERFSTALVNAAVAPVLSAYLQRLEGRLGDARLFVLQSSGGSLRADQAAREPVRVLLSGPAGGVVGAAQAAREAGLGDIVTLDMGGTSTDVAFHPAEGGLAAASDEVRVAGHPIGVPTLDIHTIGCGGGSIVRVDDAGVLHVGPESAGADPGPVAYGRGEEPTVTDAHLMLGHLAPGRFLAGELELDEAAVVRAFEGLGRRLGVRAHAAAEAVLEVARAGMRRALGVMTMQRGLDPERVPLVAFGGGGGLSAAELAGALGMPGALVPSLPGVLSAAGMAGAEALRDHELMVLAPLAEWGARRRRAALSGLARRGKEELVEVGHSARSIRQEASLDLRYRGQSFELRVEEGPDPAARFHRLHEQRYGWCDPGAEVELVLLRSRSRVPRPLPERPAGRRRPAPRRAVTGQRELRFAGTCHPTPVVERGLLTPGHVVEGPAVIEEFSGTTLVPPGWSATVKRGGHLWLDHGLRLRG